MKKIKLTQGQYAIVDDQDFEYLSQSTWHINDWGYAARRSQSVNYSKTNMILMHRVVNNTPDGFHTDHINHNKLDNRRENLRTATNQQNQRNTGLFKHNTSGYKGVSWNRGVKKWVAQIMVNKKNIHLGCYEDIEKAHLARLEGERKYWV